MKKAIVATKIGMTQIYDENGIMTPVTVLKAGPVYVTQVKTQETDGYDAVQVAYGDTREKLLSKPVKGHLAKAGVDNKKFLTEFKFDDVSEFTPGQEIKADIFEAGDMVDVSAKTKGKGFQGAIKRHGQSRGPMGHGSKFHRHAGSNGSASDPSKVFKGKKMPGQMGSADVTTQNIRVVKVLAEDNALLLEGAVPGPNGGIVLVRKAIKKA